jgi:hypothetical protein
LSGARYGISQLPGCKRLSYGANQLRVFSAGTSPKLVVNGKQRGAEKVSGDFGW